MSINVNKFPINTISGEQINGIGNLNISVTTSKSDVIQTVLSTPCTSATSSFKIQISFTTYSAWANGGIIIGHTGETSDNNDMRVFFTSTDLYYDFNSARQYRDASSYFGKVNNWEIGNYYIKNLDNNTNILTGTTQSIGTHLNYLGMWGASDSCIVHWLKIWQNGSTLTYDIIPFKDSLGYGLYDQVSHTMKYRVTNNNQVQLIENYQTQVTSLYWLDTMVNKAYMGSNLIFEKIVNYYDTQYFTIKSLEDNNIITFTKHNQSSSYITADKQIKYSKDLNTWTDISFVSDNSSQIVLNSGEKLYLKGNNSAYGEKLKTYNSGANILSSGNIDVMGNIMSLIYGDDFINNNNIEPYAFLCLFYGNTKILNAKDLILPVTTLATYCYNQMFYNCSYLVTVPELPATTLAQNCYYEMFSGCTRLKTAPELPATTLQNYCYRAMFSNCSSLTTAPELPATTLSFGCYLQMFSNCSSLTTAPELPATTLSYGGYLQMFSGCTRLLTAPELPATNLATYCYKEMFLNCYLLTTAPELPATTLQTYCYRAMFLNCYLLTTAPELPATTLKSLCYYRMFLNCKRLVTAPKLPATTLVANCYYEMFSGCTKLNYIKAMFTTTPSTSYTSNWVKNVSSTGTFVKKSSATWNVTGTNGIPSGWTVQTASA